tara:strand:- start:1251 stop:2093 length:843 start_codon:yes stop_codon:yes gene_type:complete
MSEEAITSDVEAVESTEEVQEEVAEKTWRDELPEDLQGVKTLEKFKDVSGLAKSYVETERYFEGAVRIPEENASTEEWERYYTKLGRPEQSDGYEFEKAELPEGLTYDDNFEKAFLDKAHTAGLNNKQVGELYSWWNTTSKDLFVEGQINSENTIQRAEIELRADWGRQYDEKLVGIQRLVDKYADGADKQYLEESGIGNNPSMAKFLDRLAKDFGEGRHLGDPKLNAFSDPESAQLAKDAFYNDTKSDDYQAYFDETHPRHSQAVKMIDRWNTTIHGEE